MAQRFCGGRCSRVLTCTYPERDTCKAVEAERAYLEEHLKSERKRLADQYKAAMENLETRMAKKQNQLEPPSEKKTA
jgi:hypothetical protein